ncbi:MAG: GAF domain-containing protein, partial [Oscillospiraceae bacterium]
MSKQNTKIEYTQVVWEITTLLQKAESLEEALRTSLGEVVKAVGAEAGTIWFYNVNGDKKIYPSFTIGGADLTGLSLEYGEGIAGTVVKEGKSTVVKDCQ